MSVSEDSDRFSLSQLIFVDVGLVINTLLLPVFYILYTIAGILCFFSIAIISAFVLIFIQLLAGTESTIAEIANILAATFAVLIPHFFGTLALYAFYFDSGDNDKDRVLSIEGNIGDSLFSNLWWFGLPVLVLVGIGALLDGRVSLPEIYGRQILTYLVLLFAAFVLILRMREIYHSQYESFPEARTFFVSYLLLSGSVEAVLHFSGLDYTTFLYDESDVTPSEWGMATVYIPILGPLDILDELEFLDTPASALENYLFFNSQTGEGFLQSLFILFIGFPMILYGTSLVLVLCNLILRTVRSIANSIVNILYYRLWPTAVTLCQFSYRALLYILFLRPY